MTKRTRPSDSSFGGFTPWLIILGLVVVFCIVSLVILNSGAFRSENGTPTAVAVQQTNAPAATSNATTQPLVAATPGANLPHARVFPGNWYTLYFTIPIYPEKATDRAGGVDQAIIGDIDAAQQTIDAAVFDVRLPSLVDALVRAQQRGVNVRMVVDYDANQDGKDFVSAIDTLTKGGVQVTRDTRSALMHNKFIVIDNRAMWTGSMNFTPNDTYRNNNNMLRFSVKELIQNYSARFERLVNPKGKNLPPKQPPNPTVTLTSGVHIENYFSPSGGAQQAILNRLKAATKSIRITAFTFTDTPMAAVLKSKNKAGLLVQGVFETRNNNALGAEFDELTKAGVDILQDGNCYILHSKTMVIDDTTVIMGSYNYTASANSTNDENLLIIDDDALAQHYIQEFNRIYDQAKNPTKCGQDATDDNSGGGE